MRLQVYAPAVILELNRLAGRNSETYEEIRDSGYLQDGDNVTPANRLTLPTLKAYLDRKRIENQKKAIAESQA